MLRNAAICSRRSSPMGHGMSFGIKCLCAIAVRSSANRQEKVSKCQHTLSIRGLQLRTDHQRDPRTLQFGLRLGF
jgi:hypothetical protein